MTSPRAKPGSARRVRDDALSEEQWKAVVMRIAQAGGWLVTHFTPATVVRRGRRMTLTHLEGRRGLPDLILARDGVVLFRELKTETGTLSADQRAWLEHLGPLGGVWRPRDREVVEATLLAPRVQVRNQSA